MPDRLEIFSKDSERFPHWLARKPYQSIYESPEAGKTGGQERAAQGIVNILMKQLELVVPK